jgi:hypothetical protein
MVGFTLLSRSYYYLRRRSPGPPFPPDHRQAGERGAINSDGWGVFLRRVITTNRGGLRARTMEARTTVCVGVRFIAKR